MKIISKIENDKNFKYPFDNTLLTSTPNNHFINISDTKIISNTKTTIGDSSISLSPIFIKTLQDLNTQRIYGLEARLGSYYYFLDHKLKKQDTPSYSKVKILNIPWVEIYGHCLHDVIPKLLYEEESSDCDAIYTCTSPVLNSLIELFQLQFKKVVLLDNVEIKIFSDELIIENHEAFHFRDKEKIRIFKNQIDFIINKEYQSNIANRLIYCSRSGGNVTHGRKMDLKNETEIISELQQFCTRNNLIFTFFNGQENDSTMSHLNQLKLFSEAKIVVGPHGTAMTNIIYLNPKNKCSICEFTSGTEVVIQSAPFVNHFNNMFGHLPDDLYDYFLIPFSANSTNSITLIDIDNLKDFLNSVVL
jgi:hypothetical protein